MSWNYRVVQISPEEDFIFYEFREIYYNKDGSIWAMSQEAADACGDSVEELKSDLKLMEGALEKEVLIESEITFTSREDVL